MYLRNNLTRLIQYRTCIEKFREQGINTIYSYNLGKRAGVSAEQVRKDFSKFKIKGKRKAGYDVDNLISEIDKVFHKSSVQNVLLAGYGNLGGSLARHKGFLLNKFRIIAAVDIDPSKYKKKINEVPVLPVGKTKELVKKHEIKIGIIAVPYVGAQEICEIFVEAGIRGILNFSRIVLKVPENVIVNNISLRNELEALHYQITRG